MGGKIIKWLRIRKINKRIDSIFHNGVTVIMERVSNSDNLAISLVDRNENEFGELYQSWMSPVRDLVKDLPYVVIDFYSAGDVVNQTPLLGRAVTKVMVMVVDIKVED